MKNTPSNVGAKTAFVGWLSTESRRISFLHNFLFFTYYFLKHFKSVFIKKRGYGNFNHRYNVSSIHLHALSVMGNFTKLTDVADNLHS
jgi:hypothetical protein